MNNRILVLLLVLISSFAAAEPEVVFDKKLVKKLKAHPCTEVVLPFIEDVDVKEAIECDYPEMEVIKIKRDSSDEQLAHVKLYAKGKVKNILVHYPTGLTILPEDK